MSVKVSEDFTLNIKINFSQHLVPIIRLGGMDCLPVLDQGRVIEFTLEDIGRHFVKVSHWARSKWYE
jgi:hypothetical protein